MNKLVCSVIRLDQSSAHDTHLRCLRIHYVGIAICTWAMWEAFGITVHTIDSIPNLPSCYRMKYVGAIQSVVKVICLFHNTIASRLSCGLLWYGRSPSFAEFCASASNKMQSTLITHRTASTPLTWQYVVHCCDYLPKGQLRAALRSFICIIYQSKSVACEWLWISNGLQWMRPKCSKTHILIMNETFY